MVLCCVALYRKDTIVRASAMCGHETAYAFTSQKFKGETGEELYSESGLDHARSKSIPTLVIISIVNFNSGGV